MDTVISKLQELVSSKTVIGDPVTAAGKTLIPVVKVTIGFGAGGGEGGEQGKGSGTGGGGGAGASIVPIGFIVIDDKSASLLSMKPGRFDNIAESIPLVLDKLTGLGKKKKEEKKEKEEKDE